MTETEWLDLDATNVSQMLGHLGAKASMRKCRLFACACVRRIWDDLSEAARESIEVAERFADGAASLAELRAAHVPFTGVPMADMAASHASAPETRYRNRVLYALTGVLSHASRDSAQKNAEWYLAEKLAQVELLRDVFGNPFKPVPKVPREWKTYTVQALARGIYDERAFDRMPILADALQDAGCENKSILTHCRNPNRQHVRSCWVLDLLLGKK